MKNVPNAITCLNLFSGCLACVMALQYDNFVGAFIFIALAAVFDFLDGFAARLLKAQSPIGAQLDSLSDVISFGLAPGLAVYQFMNQTIDDTFFSHTLMPCFAFLIPVFSAIRLAKFNIDTRQTNSFLGLPVPANALFWASTVVAAFPYIDCCKIVFAVVAPVLIIVFCLLMVSEIPMFSLKFKNSSWADNQLPYILIAATILLTAIFGFAGIALSILLYIALSVSVSRK